MVLFKVYIFSDVYFFMLFVNHINQVVKQNRMTASSVSWNVYETLNVHSTKR